MQSLVEYLFAATAFHWLDFLPVEAPSLGIESSALGQPNALHMNAH
jgi:hypothetical protein